MRVLVTVGASHAELAKDLAGLPPRARAARLKALAGVGLLMGTQGGAPPARPARTEPTPPSPAGIDADFAESVAQFHEFA